MTAVPHPKQVFKKSGRDQSQDDKHGKTIDPSQYFVAYDEEKNAFILTKISGGGSEVDEEALAQDQEALGKHEATPQKRYSKREKKINRKLQESGFTVYSPEFFNFDEKPDKPPRGPSNLGKRPRKRKSSFQLSTEKKKKATPQDAPAQTQPQAQAPSEVVLKEEDPDEQYCICR